MPGSPKTDAIPCSEKPAWRPSPNARSAWPPSIFFRPGTVHSITPPQASPPAAGRWADLRGPVSVDGVYGECSPKSAPRAPVTLIRALHERRVIQQRSGRAHRRPGCTGGRCTRGCVRDRVGLANGGNIAPTTRRCCQSMAASACRMISRIVFSDRELLVDFARCVLAKRGVMCPAERRGGLSGAGGSSFPKSEAQQGERAASATAPKLV